MTRVPNQPSRRPRPRHISNVSRNSRRHPTFATHRRSKIVTAGAAVAAERFSVVVMTKFALFASGTTTAKMTMTPKKFGVGPITICRSLRHGEISECAGRWKEDTWPMSVLQPTMSRTANRFSNPALRAGD